jgi:hypothetical protein
MTTGTAVRAADAIRSDRALAVSIRQSLTPELLIAFSNVARTILRAAAEVGANYRKVCIPLRKMAASVAPVASQSRALEYENLFIDKGFDPLRARLSANLAIAMGERYAEDITSSRRRIGSAMRQITQSTGNLVLARRAAALLPDLDSWGKVWVENALRKAGQPLSFEGFRELVAQAAVRDRCAGGRLREVAQTIFPYVPKAGGKALSTETVTHAIVLVLIHDFGGPAAYTYSDEAGFVDKMSAATWRHFGHPFSPTSAHKLARTLLLA